MDIKTDAINSVNIYGMTPFTFEGSGHLPNGIYENGCHIYCNIDLEEETLFIIDRRVKQQTE